MKFIITLKIEDSRITDTKYLENMMCDVLLDYIEEGEVLQCEELLHDKSNRCEAKKCLVHA